MAKYTDLPMDFADASLVVTAALINTGEILTLDERGFRTFRYNQRQRFHLIFLE